MEGMLWKWTNYFSGWQPRWFVLEQGILSYYRSQDDVINGCKGSIKMSACDVLVHPHDSNRLDLIIPSEAHFYVKAATPQERQQWLVALGSSKACLSNCPQVSPSPTVEEGFPDLTLKVKKSELRLYCDLLMQQVHSVKCAVQAKDQPDVEQLNESTSLLSATCDTFINTLEECLRLAHANIDVGSSENVPGANSKREGSVGSLSPSSATPRSAKSKTNPWLLSTIPRSTSAENYVSSSAPQSSVGGGHKKLTVRTTSDENSQHGVLPTDASAPSLTPNFNSLLVTIPKRRDDALTFLDQNGQSAIEDLDNHEQTTIKRNSTNSEVRLQTYFTEVGASFIDIRLTSDLEIPTVPFLDACRSILPIFDRLNQTAFAPARLDIASNIKRIHQKYLSAPEAYVSLQKIITSEIEKRQSHLSTSATMAILWLNRTLEFIHEIVVGFLSGSEDMVAVVNNAYTRTLMDYHGWVLRGAFAMAAKAVPSRSEFLDCFALDGSHVNHPSFLTSLQHDMKDHDMALTTVTRLLHDFLSQNSLNSQEQV